MLPGTHQVGIILLHNIDTGRQYYRSTLRSSFIHLSEIGINRSMNSPKRRVEWFGRIPDREKFQSAATTRTDRFHRSLQHENPAREHEPNNSNISLNYDIIGRRKISYPYTVRDSPEVAGFAVSKRHQP